MDLDNAFFLEGRIGSKPELRPFGDDNAVLRFSLATRKPVKTADGWSDKTSWHDCEIWGDAARRHARTLQSGDLVKVSGTITYSKYEREFFDADGQPLTLRDRSGRVVRANHKRAILRLSRLRRKLKGRTDPEAA